MDARGHVNLTGQVSIWTLMLSPRGRIGLSEYWLRGMLAICGLAVLSFVIAFVAASMLRVWQAPAWATGVVFGVHALVWMALAWMSIALSAKRLHDRDRSALWLLTILIPLVGIGFAVWIGVSVAFLPGAPGPNRFGADPASRNGLEQWRAGAVRCRIAALAILLLPAQVANPLALAFLLPTAPVAPRDRSFATIVVGGQTVRVSLSDLRQAQQDWLLASGQLIRWPHPVPLPGALLGEVAYAELNAHPEAYAMLQREAQALNVRADDSRVQAVLDALASESPSSHPPELRRAVADLLAVGEVCGQAYERARKAAEPEQLAQLDRECRQVRLALVDVKVSTQDSGQHPTPQQIAEHFNRHRDSEPGNFTADNPFGFGYRLPDRVKVQWMCLPMEQATRIAASRIGEEELVEFYLKNRDRFRESPTSQPVGPSAAPEFVPYEQVRSEILSELSRTMARELSQRVTRRLSVMLAADYTSHLRSADAPQRTTSSAGVAYNDDEYLHRMAQSVQRESEILPTVVTENQWLSASELSRLPGIGSAQITFPPSTDFPTLAISACAKPPPAQPEGWTLVPLQPSVPLRDAEGNVYLFRVVGTDPAHPPQPDDAAERVRADLVRLANYEQAKRTASGALARASIADIARDLGANVVRTGFITADSDVPIQLQLEPTAQNALVHAVFRAIDNGLTARSERVALIELPRFNRLFIVQVDEIQQATDERVRSGRQLVIQMRFAGEFEEKYFRHDSIRARLQYAPAQTEP